MRRRWWAAATIVVAAAACGGADATELNTSVDAYSELARYEAVRASIPLLDGDVVDDAPFARVPAAPPYAELDETQRAAFVAWLAGSTGAEPFRNAFAYHVDLAPAGLLEQQREAVADDETMRRRIDETRRAGWSAAQAAQWLIVLGDDDVIAESYEECLRRQPEDARSAEAFVTPSGEIDPTPNNRQRLAFGLWITCLNASPGDFADRLPATNFELDRILRDAMP